MGVGTRLLWLTAALVLIACSSADESGTTSSSLREYFGELEAISVDSDAESSSIDQRFRDAFAAAESEEEASEVMRATLQDSAALVRTSLADVQALTPPEEVAEAHATFVSKIQAYADEFQRLIDDYEQLGLQGVNEEVEGEEFQAVDRGLDEACNDLQTIADDKGVEVDLHCDGEQQATPPPTSTPTEADETASAFHQSNLANGETPGLAALLVDVPGYGYVDASAVEINNFVNAVTRYFPRRMWEGGSLHTIVDPEGSEVAFLQIYGFADGVLPDGLTRDDAVALQGGKEPTSESRIGGEPVFMFEDPKHPQSRYMYMWLIDHDTVAGADSSDQDAVVGWIEAYLSA